MTNPNTTNPLDIAVHALLRFEGVCGVYIESSTGTHARGESTLLTASEAKRLTAVDALHVGIGLATLLDSSGVNKPLVDPKSVENLPIDNTLDGWRITVDYHHFDTCSVLVVAVVPKGHKVSKSLKRAGRRACQKYALTVRPSKRGTLQMPTVVPND